MASSSSSSSPLPMSDDELKLTIQEEGMQDTQILQVLKRKFAESKDKENVHVVGVQPISWPGKEKIIDQIDSQTTSADRRKRFLVFAYPKASNHSVLFVIDQTSECIFYIDPHNQKDTEEIRKIKMDLHRRYGYSFVSPPERTGKNVQLRQQTDRWSCGLHTIKNAVDLVNGNFEIPLTLAMKDGLRRDSRLLLDEFFKHIKESYLAELKEARSSADSRAPSSMPSASPKETRATVPIVPILSSTPGKIGPLSYTSIPSSSRFLFPVGPKPGEPAFDHLIKGEIEFRLRKASNNPKLVLEIKIEFNPKDNKYRVELAIDPNPDTRGYNLLDLQDMWTYLCQDLEKPGEPELVHESTIGEGKEKEVFPMFMTSEQAKELCSIAKKRPKEIKPDLESKEFKPPSTSSL